MVFFSKSLKSTARACRHFLLALALAAPAPLLAAFGLTSDANSYTVDTGGGLVFKVRRTDNGVSTQSAGDLMSLVYNGVEYQNQSRGSQVNSGFDYLYNGISTVTVSAAAVGTDFIKVTVTAGSLTHYYLARKGYPHIYMATYFTAEPDTLGLCRFIVRIPSDKLPNGPAPSDIRTTTSTIESGDIFGLDNGETRSKHYSNMRLKDWSHIGATGTNVGVWMVRDNNEGNSGGPFYRSLLNQCGSDQEITYIVNYGEAQTEAYRTGILNSYTLVFTNGGVPDALDTSWFGDMGLTGYVASSGRGSVSGSGITGRDTRFAYTVGFASTTAQYWADASAADGSFTASGLLPGTYTLTVYKNELAVHTTSATVTAGATTSVAAIALTADPARTIPLWRIGNWDGTPTEFLNGDRITTMHPSDVRMSTWSPGTYVVGQSSASTGMPCYQWKDVGGGAQSVQFTLTAGQLAASTVRVGITTAYAGGRPNIKVNSWTAGLQGASSQPDSRTLTVGTYRGNNTTYTFSVPASAFVAGTNTLTVYPISGSSGATYLSPGYSLDAIDIYQGAAQTRAIPAAPASLNATAADGQVSLAWSSVSGASGYTVFRGISSSGPFATLAENVTLTSYADTGVVSGTTYYYVVRATNSSGQGLASPTASATAFVTLGAPASLAATPGNTQIALSWSAVSKAISYNVKRSAASGGPYVTIAAGLNATNCTDSGLVNGATYYYVVSAVNGVTESANSTPLAATPAGPPQIANLRLDDGSGTTATDSSGNGWNGTLVNGPAWNSGANARINRALGFDGADDQVTLPSGVVSALGDFTIACWVKWSVTSSWARIFDFGTGTTNYMFLTPRNGASGVVRFAIRTASTSEQVINGAAALPLGTWTHVAVTLSGATGTLYVNGVAVGANNAMTLKPSSLGITTASYLGRSQFAADPYFNGILDEFQVYNHALSQGEIAALVTPPAAPSGVSATAGNAQVSLAWGAVSGATGYNVKRANAAGGPYGFVGSTSSPGFVDFTAANGLTYYYIVTALTGAAESADSAEVSALPNPPISDAEAQSPLASTAAGVTTITVKASVPGHSYRLESCDDLKAGVWQAYGAAQAGNGSSLQFGMPDDGAAPRRFYRIRIQR